MTSATEPRHLRVLNISAGNLYGGVETLLVTMAREQALSGVEWGFAICFEGRLAAELRAAGAPVAFLGSARVRRPWTIWRARRRLAEFLSPGGWDAAICHACWPHAIAAPCVRRAKLPLVFWAHGIQPGRHWTEWWARRTRPDFMLANSQLTECAAAANLFPSVPSAVVHYPVARPELAKLAELRERTRTGLGATANMVVLIASCRLEAWKGHSVLVEALGRIKASSRWALWIAGGPQRPEEEAYLAGLRRRVDELGIADRVRFLGQRSDVPQLLASADIHCQPNTGPEPFGIAFVEALYAGLPVVTSAWGGALEIVDETCGVLVPPGSAEELAKALARLIDDDSLRHRLSANGPARAAKLCDLAARFGDLQRHLENVCHV